MFFAGTAPPPVSPWEKEIVYQIFERSFYDSNGDRIGDFDGIRQKLPYLCDLGITAILVQPAFKSRLYHNYFDDDFFQIDPTLGTNASFFEMIHAAHKRHIKVVLDMEVQYVADRHPWYLAAEKAPNSAEGKYVFNLHKGFAGGGVCSYTGLVVPIASVNTNVPAVVDSLHLVFKYWAAPPGRPQDGVDGFRLDHMMDDLDNQHVDKNMLAGFWAPLEKDVKAVKPKTFFVAEQTDWKSGEQEFQKGGVDCVYAIPLRFSFTQSYTQALIPAPPPLGNALSDELASTPPGKTQLVFIEDHDVERFASVVNSDPWLLQMGAVFNLTVKGTPSIYYGQELGMKGQQLMGATDGNDIPARLAFRWTSTLSGPGTATWYGKGPWSDPMFSADKDGISVEEEENDRRSLLNFYKRLIKLRKSMPALSEGSETVLASTDPNIVVFEREWKDQRVRVILNVGSKVSNEIPLGQARFDLIDERTIARDSVELFPHSFLVLGEKHP